VFLQIFGAPERAQTVQVLHKACTYNTLCTSFYSKRSLLLI